MVTGAALRYTNSGNGHDPLWQYIRARYLSLAENLSPEERSALDDFITLKQSEGVFILRRGALEAYLPKQRKSKDVEKLIQLLGEDFWDIVPDAAKAELSEIVRAIRDRAGSVSQAIHA